MIEPVLRWSAIAIAVAALADPSVSLSGRVRPRVAIASTAGSASDRVRDRLKTDLRAEYDIVDAIDAAPAGVIVVGDRYPEAAPPSGVPVSTVTLTASSLPNVSIAAVHAPKRVPPQTAVHLDVDVDAAGAAGSMSTLTVSTSGVEVGRLTHGWRDGRERWHAALDVAPIGEPPFVVRVEADRLPAERDIVDNVADVLINASPRVLRVLAYEPRPSWTSTFARRAIEGDGRFSISSVTETSRGVAVREGDAVSLANAAGLDTVDAIIVGGLDRVSAADVHALERFMRERGGSVALLPDGRVDTGPVRELVPLPLPAEALADAPAALKMSAPLPRIDASESLEFRQAPAGAEVLARAANSQNPVIVVVPHGDGRLLFSGALDAWRSRADRGVEFDRFWRSAIAGLALATPPLVDVEVTPSLPAAGDRVHVSARVRGDVRAVSATLDASEAVRLWPAATPGVFSGSFTAPADRRPHVVEVVADGVKRETGRGVFVVGVGSRTVTPPAAPLALLAASHGGIDVGPNDLSKLERHLRDTLVPARAYAPERPMRSPWWLVPFAACLSGEWWLRRRRGLR